MDNYILKVACEERFPDKAGALYSALCKIAQKDFCVATGFRPDEASIARSCNSRGLVFRLSEDYSALVLPDGQTKSIESVSYQDIVKFLPGKSRVNDGWKHCDADASIFDVVSPGA